MDSLLNDRFSIADISADGVPFKLDCGVYAKFVYPEEGAWAFPVGNGQYIPERWYAATVHDLTGALNNGYKHTGIDLNLDGPYGDSERTLGLSVYAVADGVVTYVTNAWSGVPMIIIRHEHDGQPIFFRYAHIVPVVMLDQTVKAGLALGSFADWGSSIKKGDHLHLDCALDKFDRQWLTPTIRWLDPVDVLKQHLPPERVDAMCKKG